MLRASSRVRGTGSSVEARQSRVRCQRLLDAKREYLADVVLFGKNQEAANKRQKVNMKMEMASYEKIERSCEDQLRQSDEEGRGRALKHVENIKLKLGNKRVLQEAVEGKGWSGLEAGWVGEKYEGFKGFLPWWHGERNLPVARDFEGWALRSPVKYHGLHQGVYEFARQAMECLH